MEAAEQPVENDEAGLRGEDAIEPRSQGGVARWGRIAAPGFEIAAKAPDQRARAALRVGARMLRDPSYAKSAKKLRIPTSTTNLNAVRLVELGDGKTLPLSFIAAFLMKRQ
jgi:hypothetical protein